MRSPLNKVLLILIGTLFLTSSGEARKARVNFDAAPADTITFHPRMEEDAAEYAAAITLAGYSKTRNASHESILAVNAGPQTVTRLIIEIDYRSMDDRQITMRTVEIPCVIPPGETRKLDFPTWDRQCLFYYHKSPAPARARATPYAVKARVTRAYCDGR